MPPGHQVKGKLAVTRPSASNPMIRPSETAWRGHGTCQCDVGHPVVGIRSTSKPSFRASTVERASSVVTTTDVVFMPRCTSSSTSLVRVPSSTATGAESAERNSALVIPPLPRPMPSKHHSGPVGVLKVAIDATEPTPTTPVCKSVTGEGLPGFPKDCVQSATVAATVGPPPRESPNHRPPRTMTATAPQMVHRRLRRSMLGASGTPVVAPDASLVRVFVTPAI